MLVGLGPLPSVDHSLGRTWPRVRWIRC